MPYKDRADSRRWYRQKIDKEAYGKLLWQRRRAVYMNEREFRNALARIADAEEAPESIAHYALREAEKREEGLWLTKRQKGRMKK
jgi:hypothetical protein